MRTGFLVLCSLLITSSCFAQSQEHEQQLSNREVKVLVNSLDRVMSRSYLYPGKADVMISTVKKVFKSGGYDHINSKAGLALQLQNDLQLVHKDSHLEIVYDPQMANNLETYLPDTAANRRAYEQDLHAAQDANFAFKKAEILAGNIGYLRWDGFFGFLDKAKPTIDAAFQFVSHTKALIIDMRYNTGGSPEMVLQLQSYFFRQQTPMNHIIDRDNDTVFRWTDPGKTDFKLNMPVYILTGKATISGGEDFCYGLKHAGRATIVGDTTRGGAHVTRPFSIGQGFVAFVPGQRAFNAVTQTDWEGTGVWPDAAVPSGQALTKAQELVYVELFAKATNEREKKELHWLLENNANLGLLAGQNQTDSIRLTKQELSPYCGEYVASEPNPVKSIFITLKGARIFRHLDNGTEDVPLVPVAPGKFIYDDDTGRAIEFKMSAANGLMQMILNTPAGPVTRVKRKP